MLNVNHLPKSKSFQLLTSKTKTSNKKALISIKKIGKFLFSTLTYLNEEEI